MNPVPQKFGEAIRRHRERLKLSQTALGERIGVKPGNISRYESGKQWPEKDRLYALADVFGVSVTELLSMDDVVDGPAIRGTVPLISWVQAGHWNDVIDPLQPGEGERVPTTYRARAHTYALRVQGDSMEPKFPDGAILIVEPEEHPSPGQYVIVRQNGGEATFKQLVQDGGRMYLKPLNPRYPIMEMKPDAAFCGVVKRIEMDV